MIGFTWINADEELTNVDYHQTKQGGNMESATIAVRPGEFVEQIIIGGRRVSLVHRDLPLDDVRLNPDNQRVQFVLSMLGHSPTKEEIAAQLWELDDVKLLLRSIQQNGGLLERIIVKADGTIIEGNCRTVVYRKLREEAKKANKENEAQAWSLIPARILPADISDKDLAYLLGELHVAGKNEWTPFEQAAWVYKMSQLYGYTIAELAQHLRKTKAYIEQLLWAYTLMRDQFLAKSKDKSDLGKWSYFLEFYKAFRRKKDAEPYEVRFVRWVRDGKFTKGAQVRKLPRIIAEPRAVKALDEYGFDEALEVLAREQPGESSRLFSAIDDVIHELRRASFEEIQALRLGDQARIGKFRQLYRMLVDLADLASFSLDEPDTKQGKRQIRG
jgi:hypothetical protein